MSPRAQQLALIAVLVLPPGAALPAFAQITETSITLAWTAPGDDSLTGQATRYDLRWSLTPINTLAEFARATPAPGVPLPQPAGGSETATVTGLTPETTYWFALRTLDEAGNISGLSNVVQGTTAISADPARPAPLVLALVATTGTSVTVSWADVGDDSLTGTASAVELRWSAAPIDDANWAAATAVFGVPAPGPPGTTHQMIVPGLDRTRDLWFAARARDDVNRVSTVGSSLFVQHLLDTAPPATPTGLTAAAEAVDRVRMHWSANAEADLAGYHVYRGFTATSVSTRLTGTPVAANDYLDGTVPDTVSVWYVVTAVDATGNESARTAPYQVFLHGAGISSWNAETPYPNPSRVDGPVTIPMEVPAAGPYDATVEIQDAAGQHVRTLRIANASPGPMAVAWDGRNDSGRATAPGVYRAWLHAGEHRVLVRFVRTP